MFKIKNKSIIILIVIVIGVCGVLSAKTIVKWKAINVQKYWSRRVAKLENNVNTFFYRPLRFEKMDVDVSPFEEIRVRVISKEKNDEVKFNLHINGQTSSYTVKKVSSNDSFGFYESLELKIPKNTQKFSIYTRNPNAYFRVFGKEVSVIKEIPKSVILKGESYKRIVSLISSKTRSDYFIADSSSPVRFTAQYDGEITSYVRFLPLADKSRCKIDVYQNDRLVNSYDLTQKISGEYSVNDQKVSVGKKIIISDIKKKDKIEFRVLSTHEILVRSILKTGN